MLWIGFECMWRHNSKNLKSIEKTLETENLSSALAHKFDFLIKKNIRCVIR